MKDDIIRMAREAGLYTILNEHAHEYGNGYFEITPYPALYRFAALARADEREAIAKMVEDWDSDSADPRDIAAAIRARGNT